MFLKNRIKLHPGDDAVRLIAEYIDYLSPIRTGVDERISFVTKPKVPPNCNCHQSKPYVCGSISSSSPSIVMVLGQIMAWIQIFYYLL